MGIPLRAEVLIQHRQGDVGQQRGNDAALGVPVSESLICRSADMTPAVRNVDQGQDAFVGDPQPHPIHDS